MKDKKPLLIECIQCRYKAFTMNKDIKNLSNCRYCNGKLEIIAIGEFEKEKSAK